MKIAADLIILGAFIGVWAVLALFVDDETLSVLASLAALLSVTYVVLVYFRNTVGERMRISKNLHGELEDTRDTLEWRKDKDLEPGMEVIVVVDEKRHRYTFTNRYLNHDVYDSLVSSGKINFLTHELQQQVQNIFKMIKHRNEFLQYTNYNSSAMELKVLIRYYEMIDEYEQSLLKQVPDMLKKLKKEFPSISSL